MVDQFSEMLDGNRIQSELVSGSIAFKRTSISLIALAQGAFVVVTGIDPKGKAFSDAEILEILEIFGTTVDRNADADRDAMRKAVISAIGSRWEVCEPPATTKPNACPFDLKIDGSTRIIFHLHIENWSFEEARIKFKTRDTHDQFGDLTWLALDGQSQKPTSFSLVDRDTKKGTYQFGLFVRVEQDGYSTRVIIDPEMGNGGSSGGGGGG